MPFGFSSVTFAVILDPTAAVVLTIVPLLASHVSLLAELDRESFRSCARRFWPYVLAAAVPGLVGVEAGKRVRAGVPERYRDRFVYGLLLVVGGKLTPGGLGLL